MRRFVNRKNARTSDRTGRGNSGEAELPGRCSAVSCPWLLARRAQVRTALGDHDPLYGPAACGAGLAGTSEYVELITIAAAPSTNRVEIGFAGAQSGAHVANPSTENSLDSAVQASRLRRVKRAASTARMQPRFPQGLIDVDIPESGDHGLVEQQGLEHPVVFLQNPPQSACREFRAQWLRPQLPQHPRSIIHQVPPAERARVVKPHQPAVVQLKHDSIMRIIGGAGTVDMDLTGHPQVGKQPAVARKRDHDKLAATRDTVDAMAGELLREVRGPRHGHGAAESDMRTPDRTPGQPRPAQIAHHSLYFRKLRHHLPLLETENEQEQPQRECRRAHNDEKCLGIALEGYCDVD
jgi:hypothetical protein